MASQSYNSYVNVQEVIGGNDAIIKCSIPSFVIDFVSVVAWVDSEGAQYLAGINNGNLTAGSNLAYFYTPLLNHL